MNEVGKRTFSSCFFSDFSLRMDSMHSGLYRPSVAPRPSFPRIRFLLVQMKLARFSYTSIISSIGERATHCESEGVCGTDFCESLN